MGGQDDWLLELGDAVGDNTMRWIFAEALSGERFALPPVAPKKLLRWLDSRNGGARQKAQHALYRVDKQAAHAKWREVLTTSHDSEAISDVLWLLEAYGKDLLPWANALFPHLHTKDNDLLFSLSRLISLKPTAYRACVAHALTAPAAELPRLLEVIADRLYWASLHSKSLLAEIKGPLQELRERAAQRGLTKHVQRLDLALKKLGVKVLATTAKNTGLTLGKSSRASAPKAGLPWRCPPLSSLPGRASMAPSRSTAATPTTSARAT